MVRIGKVDIDLAQASSRVRFDLRDDWFGDPLSYKDTLDDNVLDSFFTKHVGKNGAYDPFNSELYNLPKPGFTIRYTLETNVFDRVMYQALVDAIAHDFDKTIQACSYSHRVNRRGDKFLFRSAVDAWRNFVAHAHASMSPTYPFLLVTDVQNFYESIDVDDLINSLLSRSNDLKTGEESRKIVTSAVSSLGRVLKRWSKFNGKGIPQNRDASSFLANAFLAKVDRAMMLKGYKYFRYMDDIRIVCRDKFEARRVLQELIIELRELKLNVNSKKTRIIHMDDEEIVQFLPNPDRELEEIDSLWKSKKSANIIKSLPKLNGLAQRLISENRLEDRAFRFCLHRLEKVSRCDMLRPAIDFSPIINAIVSELINQPWASDSIVRFLKVVDLEDSHVQQIAYILKNPHINVYEWQAYHLWCLLSYKKVVDDELVSIAKDRLQCSRVNPEVAGASLYIGIAGNSEDKISLAQRFNCLQKSFLVQRCALIALHELDYKSYIEPYVKGHVMIELEGTYARIREGSKGIYIQPVDKLKPSEIFRDLPDHVS